MKTILITGATGFLGSYIVKKLIEKKYRVIVLKRSFSDIWRIKNFITSLKYYDIDRLDDFNKIFLDNKIDAIIHTATNYSRKDDDLAGVIKTNILFPLKLLEYGLKHNVNLFINSDTFTQINYGRLIYYAISKNQLVEWLKLHKDKIIIFNMIIQHMYGKKDNKNKFIPFVIKEFLNKSDKIDLTKGEQKRDFIYVEDVADAYIKAVENCNELGKGFYSFEIGTGIYTTIKDLVLKIKDISGNQDTKLNFGAIPYADNEIMDLSTNFINTNKMINFKASINLDDGLEKVIKWYKKIHEQ